MWAKISHKLQGMEHSRLDKGKSPIVDSVHHRPKRGIPPVAGVAFDPIVLQVAKNFLMNSSSQFGINSSNGASSSSQVYSSFPSSGLLTKKSIQEFVVAQYYLKLKHPHPSNLVCPIL